MFLTSENILLVGSILLFIALFAWKTLYRYWVPFLLLFVSLWMLAWSDWIWGIYFDNPKITQFIWIVALNFILFSWWLETNWRSVKPVLKEGVILSTVWVFLTTVILWIFISYISDFTIYEWLLLWAIISSTDSAAVFSILKSKNLFLKWTLRPLLELESWSNDPMAYILTILLTNLIISYSWLSFWATVFMFSQQFFLWLFFGFLFSKISVKLINKIDLDYDWMYAVLVIAILFFVFSFTDSMWWNWFLAIYMVWVFIWNNDIKFKKRILRYFDSFAWLMQIVLFITLWLLVFPSKILEVFFLSMAISLFLMFVIRPIVIFSCLSFFKTNLKEKIFISWVWLRWAVPIVFATYPLLAWVKNSQIIFDIVFLISFTSVLIQWTSLPYVAKKLWLLEK